jgi:hypothetical protein
MKTQTHIPTTASTEAPAQAAWNDANGAAHEEPATRALLSHDLYLARPNRVGNHYKGQRNYHGHTWFSNTQSLVWHESLFERQALLWLDFTYDIVAVSAQPMKLTFANGREHTPDFMALHSDQRQVVYDVKPAKRITAKYVEQFAETAKVCADVGWGYEVISEFDPIFLGNLLWMSNFRHHNFAPPPEARARLLAALNPSSTIRVAATALSEDYFPAAMGWIQHLAWLGDILFDHTVPLSSTTTLWKAPLCELLISPATSPSSTAHFVSSAQRAANCG